MTTPPREVPPPEVPPDMTRSEFLEYMADPARMAEFFAQRYHHEGRNPLDLLALFAECTDRAGDSESVAVPAWAARLLADGFVEFLNGIARGEKPTLEGCLGITRDARADYVCPVGLGEMAEHVHLLRWLFGLGTAEACHAVYSNDRLNPSRSLGIDPGAVSSQSEKTFLQEYQRKHAGQFQAWAANRPKPSQKARDKVLTLFPPELAARIRRKSKPLK